MPATWLPNCHCKDCGKQTVSEERGLVLSRYLCNTCGSTKPPLIDMLDQSTINICHEIDRENHRQRTAATMHALSGGLISPQEAQLLIGEQAHGDFLQLCELQRSKPRCTNGLCRNRAPRGFKYCPDCQRDRDLFALERVVSRGDSNSMGWISYGYDRNRRGRKKRRRARYIRHRRRNIRFRLKIWWYFIKSWLPKSDPVRGKPFEVGRVTPKARKGVNPYDR